MIDLAVALRNIARAQGHLTEQVWPFAPTNLAGRDERIGPAFEHERGAGERGTTRIERQRGDGAGKRDQALTAKSINRLK